MLARSAVSIVALSTMLLASANLAQARDCSHRELTVYVKDLQGRPIAGLSAEDFEAHLRGKLLKILSAVPDGRPHRVLILLDASGSMADRWEQTVFLAQHAVDTLSDSTQMALLVYGTKAEAKVGFSSGRRALGAELQALQFDKHNVDKKIRGRTALYDGLLSAIQLLGSPTNSDILYVITDAGENSSQEGPKHITRLLEGNNVHLFLSLFVSVPFGPSRSEQYLGALDLTELASKAGGEFVTPFLNFPHDPKNPTVFDASLKTFELSMIDDYLLDIALHEPLRKSEKWTLKLSKEKREQWKNARVLYTNQLAPCQK